MLKVALGSDHAGYAMKQRVAEFLAAHKYDFEDFGTDSEASVDYPDIAVKVGQAVAEKHCDMGILLCGTGIGMSMAANKVPGIRAAVVYNEETARLSREHNNANVLTLGARQFEWLDIQRFVTVFLNTPFPNESRHDRRIKKIHDLTR